jgi:NAD dependent epimerase/dehydratase family enzyme
VRDWEHAAHAAAESGVRVAQVRTGLALSDAGGSLLPQLPLFLAGVGGRLTDADAMTSWISLDDIVRVFAHATLSAEVTGPLNGVAPEPVTAREFARTLGAVLHRPALVPVPSFGPKLVLGGAAADELIEIDQNVSSARLEGSGFVPAHPHLEGALRHLLRR